MAADRLTQLQDAVNFQAENFCNSIGIIQEMASGTQFSDFEKCSINSNSKTTLVSNIKDGKTSKSVTNCTNNNSVDTTILNGTTSNGKLTVNSDDIATNGEKEDFGKLFARLISRTAKDIDILVDSLPPSNESDSSEQYTATIRRLEQDNMECAAQLEQTIKKGELMLEKIQAALAEIALLQLKTQNLE